MVITNIGFSTLRNTFARVLTLLVALGSGIVITPQEVKNKYRLEIVVLSVLYMLSNAAYLYALHLNQETPLSKTA